VILVSRVNKENRVTLVFKAHKDYRVILDILEHREKLDK
jgi:hypothetical protein